MTRALVLWFGGFDAYKTFVIMSCHTVQQMCFFFPAASRRCLAFLTAFSCFSPPQNSVMEKVLMGIFISSQMWFVYMTICITCQRFDMQTCGLA